MTRSSPNISVPKSSQFDERVKIYVHGLPANKVVTLYAVVKVTEDIKFESFAIYQTSSSGTVDLSHDPSMGGSYTGVEPMGLFWAMEGFSESGREGVRFASKSALAPKVYDFCVIDREVDQIKQLRTLWKDDAEQFVAKTSVQRRFMAPGVRRIEVREQGLHGVLFLPPGDGPFPAILNLFGGYPGVLEFKSALHASHGFASMTLAYYGMEGLPRSFTDTLDLAYFEKGVQFLKKHPAVDGDLGVALVGMCKGAQITLAMASCLEDIRCVVWVSCTINAACGSLAYKDLFWPQIPLKENVEMSENEPIEIKSLYDIPEPGTLEDKYDGVFPFYQRHDVSYLLIAGSDDRCAAAGSSAVEADILLKRSGHPDYEIAHYEKAGHMLEPPFSPHCDILFQPGRMFDFLIRCGGEQVAHCKAQEHCWLKQLNFLKTRMQ